MFIIPKEVAFLNLRNWLVGGIIVAAIVGLITQLIKDPSKIFLPILFMGMIVGFVFLMYRFVIAKNHHEYRSYNKAAKFSKKRYRQSTTKSVYTNKSALKKPLRKRSAAHLTVIEGKKNKKKDRAIF